MQQMMGLRVQSRSIKSAVGILLCAVSAPWCLGQREESRRSVTIADAIEMPQPAARIAQSSPDGKYLAAVVKRGRLKDDTNEYAILLWRTDQIFSSPSPEIV